MKQFIKNFNNLIKSTIFKVKNKTNNKNKVSSFNRYLITLIALLFISLFYLLIPTLYDKNWVQQNIEHNLLKEFKINFSLSSDISYNILPSPHFLIKDTKIFKQDGNKKIVLSDIKSLKVFISKKNFFDKEKMELSYVKIVNANFSLFRDDFKFIKNATNNKFSNKKIKINKSKIFFKDISGEVISIIKIIKASLFLDNDNLFYLKGEVFNVPFIFNFEKKFNPLETEIIDINTKSLKLDILNTLNVSDNNNDYKGENIISFINSTVRTKYKIEDNMLIFESTDSKIKNKKIDYKGKILINPFDLNLDINVDNYALSKLSNLNFILSELVKTELFFNNNISVNTSINVNSNEKKEIFQNANIKLNIINGKINFNKTRLINDKIGSLTLKNSNLFFKNKNLTLNTDIFVDLKNIDALFFLLQTTKKSRKSIKSIQINLDYDFLTHQTTFNNIKIDNKKVNDEMYAIIKGFTFSKNNNWIKSKRIVNELFRNYEG
tara:strand:+ start:61 stop:1539 length:1479 start_codon:yes stop_codon:yes gene_type:complete